ncbi:MAG: glycosyltransferase family 4 protein [Chloroflexi bacterium]|nr:glycosyltransferase family 4 protein [Chloroflexota bacterium]
MKIHFVYPTYVRDGAEGITINIATLRQALERRGIGVRLGSPGVDLADLNRKWTHVTKGLATLPHLIGGLSDAAADLVHYHMALPSQSLLARLAQGLAHPLSPPRGGAGVRAPGQLLIGQLWNSFIEAEELALCHSRGEALAHRLLNNATLARLGLARFDALVVASQYQERQLRRIGYGGPIHQIPNGVDLERFRPPMGRERAAERARLGLPPESLIVTYYGHLTPWKGVLHLVRAFATVAEHLPAATLVIARTSYGTEEALLRREIGHLGLDQRVIFLGQVDPPALLRASDVGVVPAIAAVGTAVYANVLLEMLASGLPTIATSIATTAEVIAHGRDGLLVPPAQSATLGAALVYLLKDEPLRVAMSQAARRTAAQRFDWENIADRLTEVYAGEHERVLDAANRRGGSAPALVDLARAPARVGS